MILPDIALSVRQPWAWAIIHGGKDIENRSWHARKHERKNVPIGQRVCVHAAQGMTKYEYEDAADLFKLYGVLCPPPDALIRGGIIGTVRIAGAVTHSHSRWFFGPFGIVLADPEPLLDKIRVNGDLGWFQWHQSAAPWPEPAKWMLPKSEPLL